MAVYNCIHLLLLAILGRLGLNNLHPVEHQVPEVNRVHTLFSLSKICSNNETLYATQMPRQPWTSIDGCTATK